MIYQLSSQRTVTVNNKKNTQVFSYCWKGAAALTSNTQLRNAALVWAGLLDTFNPTGGITSSWIYSQVMQLPDNSTALAVDSAACDIIFTAVDLNNVNAPCSVKLSTTGANFVTDVTNAIKRLMNITPPNARVLITNATIRVKEA